MKCEICEKENYVIDTKKFPAKFCSYSCYEQWQKFNKTPNCECSFCGIKMYLKPSRLKRIKNGISCSLECSYKVKSEYMKNEGNHQFGLKGDLNDSFKGFEIERVNHNNIDLMIYIPMHPYANKNGRVLKHRYIIEQNYTSYDSKYFEVVDNYIVLKKEYDVHHIDCNHNNNDIKNLIPLTRSEHTSLHNNVIGVFKQGELLETPEEDNQQPSLDSNVFEGSTTNNRVLPDNAENSNIDTSALPLI